MEIRRILVPTDFSTCSEHATREALDLAARLGAHVTLLHAYGLPVYMSPEGGALLPSPETMVELTESARNELLRLKQRVDDTGLVDEVRAEQSPAADAIVRVANEGHFDLIVMGTHGRTGLKHLLVGSVAERVVRMAMTPVLTVHDLPA